MKGAIMNTALENLKKIALTQYDLNNEWPPSRAKEPLALDVLGSISSQLAIGIQASLSVGSVISAFILCRTAFEALLSTKLICQEDKQIRSKLYMSFATKLKWDYLQEKLNNLNYYNSKENITEDERNKVKIERENIEAICKEIEPEYEEIKSKYKGNWWDSVICGTDKLHKVDIKCVCKYLDSKGVIVKLFGKDMEVTFLKLQEINFSLFSKFTHPTAITRNINDGKDVVIHAMFICSEIIADCAEGPGLRQSRTKRRSTLGHAQVFY
jgi:hypothetical protein